MWNEDENEEMNVTSNLDEVEKNDLEEKNVNDVLPENKNSESEPEKNHKKGIFIAFGIVLALLLILCIVCVAFKMFARNSNEMEFVKLLTENQLFVELLEDEYKYEQKNMELSIDTNNIAHEINDDETDVGVISLNTILNEKDGDFSAKANLNVSSLKIKIPEIQLIKTGNLIGLNVDKIFPKVVSLDLKNPEGLKKNLEFLGIKFSDKVDEYEYSEEDYENMKKLVDKYAKIVFKEFSKGLSKENTKAITLDGEEYKVSNVYVLKLDSERWVKAFYAVVKELSRNRNDLNYLEQFGIIENSDEFSEYLDYMLEEIEDVIKEERYDEVLDGILYEDLILKVYEESGKTIATVLEVNDISISLYTIKGDKDNFKVIFEIIKDDEKAQLVTYFEKDENNVNGSLRFIAQEYDETFKDLELCKFKIEKLKNAEEDILKVEKDESISLNKASEEELKEFTDQVEKNIMQLIGPLFVGD